MQQFNESSLAFLSQLVGMTFTMFFIVGICIYLAVMLSRKMFVSMQIRKRVKKVNKLLAEASEHESTYPKVVYNTSGIPVILQTSKKLIIL